MPTVSKDLQKREAQTPDAERTRPSRVYVPRVDIHENKDAIVLAADMPGVDESSVEITVDKNVLTIQGHVHEARPEGHQLTFAEYEIGDYQRVFTLPNEIDQSHIEASVRNGVLRLTLPKAQEAKPKKIQVRSAA